MNVIGSGAEGSSQTVYTQSSLISGLPDDIALTCLARIPRKYHSLLKCVSRKWRDLVCSEEWYSYRRKHNLAETWIYALCKDKSEQLCCYVLDPDLPKRGWKRIPDLSARCLKRKGVGFEVLGKKIYFLGGCGWVEDATDEVYCYDASRNAWSEASPLSTPRCYFACEAMDGKMYAVGGLGSKSNDPHSWDTFDSTTNSWTSHMDPNIVPEIQDSLVLDGKIYIRCGLSAVSSHVYAVVYDPVNGTWQHADADMVSGWRGPGIVVDNTLYVLDQTSGTRVMMWRKDIREWEAFGRLAAILTRPPCRLVAIGKKMFVVGKGLSTVVFDVDKAANIDGMLVTTSVPKLPSDDDQMQMQKTDSDGTFRLLYCSGKGNKCGVMQELDQGVEPNVGDCDRRTALHLAACEGFVEIVLLLLEKGADVNSTDRWGRTPLADARRSNHIEICKLLEAHGGIDPAALDSRAPCYLIDYSELHFKGAVLIGEGSYGEVYKVKWRGTEVAAKAIRSSLATNEKVRKIFLEELALWQKLRHPNIVQFLGFLNSDRLIFLTEYLKNGSLLDILRKKGRLDPLTAVSYALDIARGMNYLHSHKPNAIIHRDLTPRNVLLDEAGHLKVTNFSLSKTARKKDVYGYKMTGGTGSYRYMAPEVYRRESYDKSVDVYSFAFIVHEMFQGGPSNSDELPEHLAAKRAYENSRPPLSSYIYPEPVRMLLQKCWHRNPDVRPKFEEIIIELEFILEIEQRKLADGFCHTCGIL